eukprot:115319-Lingulodinium_polyedra.AAC.1
MASPGETARSVGEKPELVALNYIVNHSSLGNWWQRWSSLGPRGGARSRWYQTLSVTIGMGSIGSSI